MRNALRNVHDIPSLSYSQQRDLKRKLEEKAIRYPASAGTEGIQDFVEDVQTGKARVLPAVQNVVSKELGGVIGSRLQIEVEKLPFENDCRVQTNLRSDFGIDEQTAHRVVEKALLGLAALNQRIRLMQALEAVTGFRDSEAPVFEARLRFISSQLDPDAQERRFDRVTKLTGLPSVATLGPDAKVDVEKLLRLRNSRDCVELRRWLRTTDGQSDDEIEQQFHSVREKLAALTHSKTGKAIRFVVSQVVGAIPGPGIVLGPASSVADQFIAERVIGAPGPVCFLSHEYRSIFKA